jgi:dTDP-4-dehydrorhamnose reductase
VEAWRPQVIINAAAYTAVDKAEIGKPLSADAINAQRARAISPRAGLSIERCAVGAYLYRLRVRRAALREPYQPGDRTNPAERLRTLTKLAGRAAPCSKCWRQRAVVLRTAWVYAAQGKNFLLTMLRLMRERGAVRVVADQRGSPTAAASDSAGDLANRRSCRDVQGVLHWTDDGVASWYEFACAIAEDALAAGLLPHAVQVTPITTADYPTAAHRPANSVLDIRGQRRAAGHNTCALAPQSARHFGATAAQLRGELPILVKPRSRGTQTASGQAWRDYS